MFFSYILDPFLNYAFMQKALFACFFIVLSGTPLGVFIVLKRNSLMGEALSHGIMPGIAVSYVIWGMNITALLLGGTIAGILAAFMGSIISKNSVLYEDASFSAIYITFLAIGVLILSSGHGNMNITHLLFGNILAVNKESINFIAVNSIVTVLTLLILYNKFLITFFDKTLSYNLKIKYLLYQVIFLTLVVFNLVIACQALGTLMSLGVMMIPAISARLLSNNIKIIFLISFAIGLVGSIVGLVTSFYHNLSSGSTIVAVLGLFYILSFATHKFVNKNIKA